VQINSSDRTQSISSIWHHRLIRFFSSTTTQYIAAGLSLILIFNTYYLLIDMKVFGHDEVHYYTDFTFKLKEEGRWANYFLHKLLRHIPLQTHVILFLSSLWGVFYYISKNLTKESWYSIIIASVLLIETPNAYQSLWPATVLPTTISLLLLAWMAQKDISYKVIYLVGGVLLFGMMQNYYFLLPLLFLGHYKFDKTSINSTIPLVTTHLLFWITGAVSGLVVASLIVYIHTGQAGIIPAEWRLIMPAHDISTLLRNIIYVFQNLTEQLVVFWKNSASNGFLYPLLLIIFTFARLKNSFSNLYISIILSAVFLSFFIFSIPLAPIIQTRSLVAFSSSLILLFFIESKQLLFPRWLSVFLLLWTGLNLSISGRSYLYEHKTQSEFVLNKIEAAFSHHPANYTAVAVFGHVDNKYKEAFLFNNPERLRPIILTLGANHFIDGRVDTQQKSLLTEAVNIDTTSANNKIKLFVTKKNVAVILLEKN